MSESIRIPADMLDREAAECFGAEAVVSIRDMLILLGATDQQLRDIDERQAILEREPWRTAARKWVEIGKIGEMTVGYYAGQIDWSGTRFAE